MDFHQGKGHPRNQNPDSLNQKHLLLFKLHSWPWCFCKGNLELIVVKIRLQDILLFSLRFQCFGSRISLLSVASPPHPESPCHSGKVTRGEPSNIVSVGRKTHLSYKLVPLAILSFTASAPTVCKAFSVIREGETGRWTRQSLPPRDL